MHYKEPADAIGQPDRVMHFGGLIAGEHMLHGRAWRGENITGWFASEKMDGCRGYWDGERMWSRSGRVIPIPILWPEQLPSLHLDGEIWAGRGSFDQTVSTVVRNVRAPEVCFLVFDAPEIDGAWPARLNAAAKNLTRSFAATVPYTELLDLDHASRLFRTIRLAG